MDITVKAFSSPLLANALSYLVSVKKSGGRNNEYIVEIKRLPTMLQNCFGYYWSGYHLQNCCWLIFIHMTRYSRRNLVPATKSTTVWHLATVS